MVLKSNDNISVRYHKIFDYVLTKEVFFKWQYKNQKILVRDIKSKSQLQREKYSESKLQIAKRASKLISKVPTVLFVGITGSLAMMNADKDSDIDLIIITKRNTLWTTRMLVYGILWAVGYGLRKPDQHNEKDKLCLNMWLDETSLVWDRKDRNIYTGHEIAQIAPLVNKKKIYEIFLQKNKWILDFWPNAVVVQRDGDASWAKYLVHSNNINILEKVAFKLQYLYMKNKITTEIVTPNKAIFHKNDWGKVVMGKLTP